MTAPSLARKAFSISRLSEFASVSELGKMVGQPAQFWPAVIMKELVDNAIDAAEEAGEAPVVVVTVGADGAITVADQGPGVPAKMVKSLADFAKRTSSRALYVSPSRGQQGNALQSIIAMPFALDGERGLTTIESRGIAHRITFTVDPVRQIPRVAHATEPSTVKNGLRITVHWPDRASSMVDTAKADFLSLGQTFAWLNPHLTLSLVWAGEELLSLAPTDPEWSKWRPDMPTSAWWYSSAHLSRLMGGEIAHAEDHRLACPTLRDFARQFRGLSSTIKAKEVCEAVGASGDTLAAFHARGGSAAARLLLEMRGLSRPVQPRDLGVIGKEALLERFVRSGADAATFEYRSAAFEHDGLPYVIETGFALYEPEDEEDDAPPSLSLSGEDEDEDEDEREDEDDDAPPSLPSGEEAARRVSGVPDRRILIEGFNFTPAIGASPFRLEGLLAQQMVGDEDPVIAFVHLVSPRLEFLDRGKARVALPSEVGAKLRSMVEAVTQKWRKQRKAEERHASAVARRWDALRRENRPITTKEAAFQVMEEAYNIASAGRTLPANARQVYYGARPLILELTGKDTLDSAYFTQTLLVDYIEENECDWDVVFDARGHLAEPHGGATVDLGTLAVREYLDAIAAPSISEASIAGASVSTFGPSGAYGAVLFVEKEGFGAILDRAQIADRFDIAIMSTKGMSVTAARILVDNLAGRGVRLYVLHDFDISGFSIKKTLTESGRRHRFQNKLDFVDLGLRLADVERLSLQSEPVALAGDLDAKRRRLRINGATEPETAFLLSGLRVELNAMPSDVFVRFVEDGLRAHGATKVIPDPVLLAEAYAAMKRATAATEALKEEMRRLTAAPVETPPDLANRIARYLTANPTTTWALAVEAIAEGPDSPRAGDDDLKK